MMKKLCPIKYGVKIFPPSDPYSAYVITAMHHDSSLADEVVANSWSIPAGDGGSQSLTDSKFGGQSRYFSGIRAVNNHAETSITPLTIGTQDFCFEAWVSLDTTTANFNLNNRNVISLRKQDDSQSFGIWYRSAEKRFIGTSSTAVVSGANGVLPVAGFNHLAFCRDNTSVRFYFNGSLYNQDVRASENYTGAYNEVQIGSTGSTIGSGAYQLSGWLDDSRITIGAARYTGASFTLPTEAFPYP